MHYLSTDGEYFYHLWQTLCQSPVFSSSILKLPASHVWLTSAQNMMAKEKLRLHDFTVRLPRQESDGVSCRFGADYSRWSWKHFKWPAVCDKEKKYITHIIALHLSCLHPRWRSLDKTLNSFSFIPVFWCLFPLKAPNVKMSVITDIQRSVIERALLSLFTL